MEDASPGPTPMYQGFALTLNHTECQLGWAIITAIIISSGRVKASLFWFLPHALNRQKRGKVGGGRKQLNFLQDHYKIGRRWSKMLDFPKLLSRTLCIQSLACSATLLMPYLHLFSRSHRYQSKVQVTLVQLALCS